MPMEDGTSVNVVTIKFEMINPVSQ